LNRDKEEMIRNQVAKAEEKLQAAAALLEQKFADDAISRAYYAMFHAASAVLLSEGITVESHSALKTMFGLHFIKAGLIDKKYGKSLSKLKDERENGDYDIFTSFEVGDAQDALEEATAFVEAMKGFLTKNYEINF
jgi:uncharacterized protein (UPF0332 family)